MRNIFQLFLKAKGLLLYRSAFSLPWVNNKTILRFYFREFFKFTKIKTFWNSVHPLTFPEVMWVPKLNLDPIGSFLRLLDTCRYRLYIYIFLWEIFGYTILIGWICNSRYEALSIFLNTIIVLGVGLAMCAIFLLGVKKIFLSKKPKEDSVPSA